MSLQEIERLKSKIWFRSRSASGKRQQLRPQAFLKISQEAQINHAHPRCNYGHGGSRARALCALAGRERGLGRDRWHKQSLRLRRATITPASGHFK